MTTFEVAPKVANVTASGAVSGTSARGNLLGVTVASDGTNACTVTIYDNSAASGTILGSFQVAAAGNGVVFTPPWTVAYKKGLYVSVSAGTPSVMVYYS